MSKPHLLIDVEIVYQSDKVHKYFSLSSQILVNLQQLHT